MQGYIVLDFGPPSADPTRIPVDSAQCPDDIRIFTDREDAMGEAEEIDASGHVSLVIRVNGTDATVE